MVGKIVVFLALVGYAAAALNTCSKNGEYCQNHWDCCSSTCLSFLYKCSHIQSPKQSGLPTFFAPRIDTDDNAPIPLNSLIQIVYSPRDDRRDDYRSRNILATRFGATDDESTTAQSTTSGPCKEVGEKCYFNEDCCTKLCHGFLHKCVT